MPTWVDMIVEPYALDNIYWVRYLETAIKEEKIRTRNLVATEELKEFLKWGTLEFKFDKFEVLVMREGIVSKEKYNRLLTGSNPTTPMIYIKKKGDIHYINERWLREYWPTELYKEWFSLYTFQPIVEKDYRYLLGLDDLNPAGNSPTNDIYKYLTKFWVGDPTDLVASSTEWYSNEIKKGVLHAYIPLHEWPAIREQRMKEEIKNKIPKQDIIDRSGTFATGVKRDQYVRDRAKKLHKAEMREKYGKVPEKKYEGPRWSQIKSDEEISASVLAIRQKAINIALEIEDKTIRGNHWPKIKYIDGVRHKLHTEYYTETKDVPKKLERYWITHNPPLIRTKTAFWGGKLRTRTWEVKQQLVTGPTSQTVEVTRSKKSYIVDEDYVPKTVPFKDPGFSERMMIRNKREKLVCVRCLLDKGITRIKESDAEELVDAGTHVFTTKQKYKDYVSKKDAPAKPGLNLTDGQSRKQDRVRPPRKGAGSMFAKIQKILDKTDEEGKVISKKVDSKRYFLDDKGKRMTTTSKYLNKEVIPIYEYLQEEKNVWEMEEWIDGRGRLKTRPKRKLDPETGRMIPILKDVIPAMSLQRETYICEETGKTKPVPNGKIDWAPKYKRVLVDVLDEEVTITRPLRAVYKTISSYQFPQRIAEKIAKAKKEMEESMTKAKKAKKDSDGKDDNKRSDGPSEETPHRKDVS